MTDITYCPRKSCQYPVSLESNELMANCPNCQYVFCIFCKAVYHGVEPCKFNSGNNFLINECLNKFHLLLLQQQNNNFSRENETFKRISRRFI